MTDRSSEQALLDRANLDAKIAFVAASFLLAYAFAAQFPQMTERLVLMDAETIAEDFSYYAQRVPGLFLWLGGMPKGCDPANAPQHHTADFFIDEKGMQLGLRTLCYLAVDALTTKK